MVTSPLKKFTHSRSSSRNSNGLLSHSRQLSSDLRKNVQGQHPPPSNLNQQQQQTKNPRLTSMDLARQYEMDRAKITRFCFSKREADGQFHENYVTHVRIIEDSHYPSSRPPLDSNPSHKKPRILMIGVKRTGRVRLHKGRENKDGSIQIGRTWDLDELTKLEKDPIVAAGFMLYLGKPYFWETTTTKEATVFNTSVINTYIKYTSKIPELIGWDLNALGITVPPNVSRNKSQSSQKGSMPPPQKIPSSADVPLNGSNQKLAIPKSRQDSLASLNQQDQQQLQSKQAPISQPKRPLQIVPPNQSVFAPQKNAVLSSSSNNLPDSRIPSSKQPASFNSQSPASARAVLNNDSGSFTGSNVTPVSSGANINGSFSSNSDRDASLATRPSETSTKIKAAEIPLSKELTAKSEVSTKSSVQGVTFNRNRASYVEVEKETDDSRDREDEYEDEEDDGYDLTNYYGELTPETEDPDLVNNDQISTKEVDPRVALYTSQIGSSAKSKEASLFVDELFSNIKWSVSDDVSTLEKKLMRQLVVAGNDSCQLLINIGDDKAGLKRSLDASIAECQKLNPLMAFFNVELLSFKDEVDQINAKGEHIGLLNRKLLYKEIASMR